MTISGTTDPIAAIATAPGKGGIGVVRISGPNLDGLAAALFDTPLKARHAHYLPFNDSQGQPIDAGIVLYFKGPHSYTGEDVLELQGHGGPAVLRRVLQHCIEAGRPWGVRHAQPGEFTQRAFLNDRLDLAQAEAVADLIDASSEAAARSAMASLSGAFSKAVSELNERIIHLRMLVEATLDFPEEEIDFLEKYQAKPTLDGIIADLAAIRRDARQGMILREGLHVVLAGRPNVGKSSLLNALAGDDVAIVTAIAGTTRDRVIQQIHIDGVPIHIVDTAGLRETDDEVERIGIARTWAEIERADVVIHLQDARDATDELEVQIAQRLPVRTPILTVVNKVDLIDATAGADTSEEDTLYISAKTGHNLDQLRRRLLDIAGWSPGAQSPWLARERHLRALEEAGEHLNRAREHAEHDDQVLDLFAEELRLAHEALGAITGQFTSDDLLGEIFSSFCIGK
ncbi:tRNA uridine-5-carboxymethylaminomethyl(34) synthesis GTPase MnmE [Yanghanlia caeni]|uniref:tRNA modification GTPase MnmE n=1 Tax=Yanghanlia caeni TaxID=3064283 RepID=A0ABU1D267_9BURK|nr:tRNA uridine-5-carboxymethylaminomethyl(34) synthesis GTPase MnmE [Alcaligenaceae bacterium LG-2]